MTKYKIEFFAKNTFNLRDRETDEVVYTSNIGDIYTYLLLEQQGYME